MDAQQVLVSLSHFIVRERLRPSLKNIDVEMYSGLEKCIKKPISEKKGIENQGYFVRSPLKKKTCELVEKVLIIINQENGYFRHFSNEFGHEMNSANWQHCLKARNLDLTDISSHHYFEGTTKVCMTIIAVSIVFSVKNAITKSFPKVDSSSTCQA